MRAGTGDRDWGPRRGIDPKETTREPYPVRERLPKACVGGQGRARSPRLCRRHPAFILRCVTQTAPTRIPASQWSLYAVTFVVGLTMITLGPVLDPILKELDIPLSQGGLISVAFAVGMLIGVVALNFFLARVPVKWGLVGAALIEAVGLAASGALASGLWSLFAAYLFVGLGCVFLNSLPGMWVTSHIKNDAGRSMVVLLLFFALGMMAGPLAIGGALSWGATWRWVFGAEAVLCLALAVVLILSPISNIEGRENLRPRRLLDVINFNSRLFIAVLVASILYIGAEFTLNVWLVKFQIDVLGADKGTGNIAMTLFWLGLLIGRLVVIPLTRRFHPARILTAGMAFSAVFSLGIALAVSVEMVMVMSFFAGLGASAAFPLILSFSARFPRWHAGVVFSAVIMAGALGRIVFPYLVGPLAESLGFRLALCLTFVLSAALSLLALYLHRVSGEVPAEAEDASA
jgi:FHS family glucose/mannose:H+ symporter-like MFS transporter